MRAEAVVDAHKPLMHTNENSAAAIQWRSGQLISSRFDDIYFSSADGIAESTYVFVEGNRLPERIDSRPDKSDWHILELGFGTGLNFLNTVAFFQSGKLPARLVYSSCELYPLSPDVLEKSLETFRSLDSLVATFRPVYNSLWDCWCQNGPGWYSCYLPQFNCVLQLALMSAADMLSDLLQPNATVNQITAAKKNQAPKLRPGPVDAIYMDGFAPAKNPAMWSFEIIENLARLSGPGTSLATFSAAGQLKRDLIQAGFQVQKIPGFGRKREMITARFLSQVTGA
ncbi:MAG: tRNA (5-methylaminomethyl-2-thiouridine)(34)-methyltransferase MnmD [Leptospiraceae bacterium]|nr:tRNA (5-methylaminomethyl-2-thiouridine)(34)-methyltransferase MnmD [Leptospiraceae bacterium]